MWQQAPESSLDPHNANGPIPFTSSAFLGLAYVRLSLNLGPHRRLETRDPTIIASALRRSPRPERSYRLIPALIYAAHALSIPVRLGIDHIARSQAFFWSVRHSLASIECAVLLSKWLFTLAEAGPDQSLSGMSMLYLLYMCCQLTILIKKTKLAFYGGPAVLLKRHIRLLIRMMARRRQIWNLLLWDWPFSSCGLGCLEQILSGRLLMSLDRAWKST